MDYLLDTNFLIGLWRGRGKGIEASFLAAHSDCVFGLPWIAKAEFLSGAVIADHDLEKVAGFLDGYPVAWPDEHTLLQYATLYARLHAQRKLVGPNDLWIAAAAIRRDLPLLTRNVKEFSRVEGLRVVDYAVRELRAQSAQTTRAGICKNPRNRARPPRVGLPSRR